MPSKPIPVVDLFAGPGGLGEGFSSVKDTYGKMKTIVNPVVSGAQISGVGLESRIDRKFKVWNKMSTVAFDINVV